MACGGFLALRYNVPCGLSLTRANRCRPTLEELTNVRFSALSPKKQHLHKARRNRRRARTFGRCDLVLHKTLEGPSANGLVLRGAFGTAPTALKQRSAKSVWSRRRMNQNEPAGSYRE